MRFSFCTMGTVVSVEWHASSAMAATASSIAADVDSAFTEFDLTFSLFRTDSELSRIADGTHALDASSTLVRSVYAQALEWSTATSGAFTPHRSDRVIDLSGIVKALAIKRAGDVLDHAGVSDWSINAGGDILCSANARGRRMGIVDPRDRERLLCAVTLGDGRRAMATSGSAERGDHIWPRTPDVHDIFDQVTVLAPDIVTADVLATAIVAGGAESLDDVTSRWDVDVLTIDPAGSFRATPGFRSALERSDRQASS